MRYVTRLLALGGVTSMLATLMLAGTAHADGLQMGCVVQGPAKMTDYTAPGGVQLISGSGTYTFDSLIVTCAGLEQEQPVVVNLDVTSQGTYENLVCGTGTATSTSNVLTGMTTLAGTPTTDLQALVAGLSYRIDFVATAGILTWTGSEDVGGYVQLSPDPITKPSPPTPPACTKAFQIDGALTLPASDCIEEGNTVCCEVTSECDPVDAVANTQYAYNIGADWEVLQAIAIESPGKVDVEVDNVDDDPATPENEKMGRFLYTCLKAGAKIKILWTAQGPNNAVRRGTLIINCK